MWALPVLQSKAGYPCDERALRFRVGLAVEAMCLRQTLLQFPVLRRDTGMRA
jgi:hypothetical protein